MTDFLQTWWCATVALYSSNRSGASIALLHESDSSSISCRQTAAHGMSSYSSAVRLSLGDDADHDTFHAKLAFLDEYDGDIAIDLHFPSDSQSSTSESGDLHSRRSSTSTWPPASTTVATAQSDGASFDATRRAALPPPRQKVPVIPAKRRLTSHAEDPRMRAKTVEEGAYPSRTRKAELTYLKTKVHELEERLRVLHQTKRLSNDASYSHESLSAEALSGVVASDSMWEDVAMRQFEQRQQSEIENQRLLEMLESQLRLARGLERLLKRTNVDLLLPTNSLKRPRLTVRDDGAAHTAAFDELLGVVDEMYSQLDDVFSDARFNREDVSLRDIQVRNDASLGTVVDVFDARNLPFDLRPTADAVWSYFVNTSVSDERGTAEQVEITDDVIKKHFTFAVDVQRHHANFHGRLAARRFFEDDRIVILWVAIIEPEIPTSRSGNSTSKVGSEGMVVRQKGWTIVKNPHQLPPNCDPDSPVTRIQSKHVAIPFVYEDVPDHKRKTGTLTNFVLQSVYSHLQTSRKMVENVLLQGVMAKGADRTVYGTVD